MKWSDMIKIKKMDSTKRFSTRVTNYQKYRPNYPPEAIDYIYTSLDLRNKVLTDIGAGTGIMTELFLKRGNLVYAVEPNDEMRSEAEKLLSHYANFKSITGTAENTQLTEKTVDCIICAQAFHWFNTEESKREFHRILKDDGHVVLVWNRREPDSPFAKEYEKLLVTCANDYKEVGHHKIDDSVFCRFFRNFSKAAFRNRQSFDLTGFKGRVFSSSYTPQTGDANYESFMTNLERLFQKYQIDGAITFSYNTEVIIGNL